MIRIISWNWLLLAGMALVGGMQPSLVRSFSMSSSQSIQSVTNSHPTIEIAQVESILDWYALADARYDEWIAGSDSVTSKVVFRRATLDIYKEDRPHSMLFLAKKKDDGTVVGAAELSPKELANAVQSTTGVDGATTTSSSIIYYVTDVVTNRNHRRQGIAASMMNALEEHAIQVGAKYLILHVADGNTAAFEFYQRLGYNIPTESLCAILDQDQVAKNAGTNGQQLLSKEIGR